MRVALTGGIGAGKSSVARLLAGHGAVVIDADAIAREVVAPGTPGLVEVLAAFGPDVKAPDGSLDRPALGRLVFGSGAEAATARARLEAITHPRIGARVAELMGAAPPGAVVVYDVPLLLETGDPSSFDAVLVVAAPRETRLRRLEERGLRRADAEQRMAAQASDEGRRAVATVVLDNGGDPASLAAQVDAAWARLTGT